MATARETDIARSDRFAASWARYVGASTDAPAVLEARKSVVASAILFAERERNITSDRVVELVRHARAPGVDRTQPYELTPDNVADIRAWIFEPWGPVRASDLWTLSVYR